MRRDCAVALMVAALAVPLFAADNGKTNAVDNTGRNIRDRDSAAMTSGDQGNSPADIQMTQRIRKAIMDSDLSVTASNVKVITRDGKVTLRGPVKSEEEKRRIGAIAATNAMPRNVDNQLEVKRATE